MIEGDCVRVSGWLAVITAIPSVKGRNLGEPGSSYELIDVRLVVALNGTTAPEGSGNSGDGVPGEIIPLYRMRLEPIRNYDPVLVEVVMNFG